MDNVFVFWSNKPFGGVRDVLYKGKKITFPKKFDNSIEIINSIESDKIITINQHFNVNSNSFTKMYNEHILVDYDECDILMMIEVDHVFREDQLIMALDEFIDDKKIVATTEQWEIWKGFKHCVPQWNDEKVNYKLPKKIESVIKGTKWESFYDTHNPRNRLCTMFLNMEHYGLMPKTGMHCNPVKIDFFNKKHRLQARTHNFGFAVSEKTMYWKHLVSIGIAESINDTRSNVNWYEDKWLTWDYEKNNSDLEISLGYEWHIPYCIPYDIKELPKSILKRMGK